VPGRQQGKVEAGADAGQQDIRRGRGQSGQACFPQPSRRPFDGQVIDRGDQGVGVAQIQCSTRGTARTNSGMVASKECPSAATNR
jgi:hypothetical protein